MSNTVSQEHETSFVMDRPHYSPSDDLVNLAKSFVDYSVMETPDRYADPKLFIGDFVFSARELEASDIEHTEAIDLLERVASQELAAHRVMMEDAAQDIFDDVWLVGAIDLFEDDEGGFIELYKKGELGEYIHQRWEELLWGHLGSDCNQAIIHRLYDEILNSEVPAVIASLIEKYQVDPEKFTKQALTIIRIEEEHTEGGHND